MNKNIAAFPAATLYNDELFSDPSVADHTLLDLPTIANPSSEDSQDLLSHTVVFFDTAGCEFFERTDGDSKGSIGEGSKSNENEAAIVAKWARKLVSGSSHPDIFSPTRSRLASHRPKWASSRHTRRRYRSSHPHCKKSSPI